MPALPHNIEKSAFKRGAYVGYGGGVVWHITKAHSSYGTWMAAPIPWITGSGFDPQKHNSFVYAFRLSDMGAKLEALAIN